jgi:hypothetical protein
MEQTFRKQGGMMNTAPDVLRQASVQDIYLELIRRSGGNFDGDEVAQMLSDHRDLWIAAMIDNLHFLQHPAVPTFRFPTLYKLRDLPLNQWNADTLYVITPDEASRDQLMAISEQRVGGMAHSYTEAQIDRMVSHGGIPSGSRIFHIWWD